MYRWFIRVCDRALRLPPDPKPPPGDEASARLFRAAPKFFIYLLMVRGLKILGAIVALILTISVPVSAGLRQLENQFSVFSHMFELELALAVLGGVVALVLVRLDYEKRWYLVTDRSFRIREGVWVVKEMTVNFANIQNLTISEGPIQRLLGIADLRVDTAGGGGSSSDGGESGGENLHTAWFRGINNAAEVRALIQERLSELKDSGLGDELDQQLQPTAVLASYRSAETLKAASEILEEARALRKAATAQRRITGAT